MLGSSPTGPFLYEGGEYVMNSDAVSHFGVDFMEGLNSYRRGGGLKSKRLATDTGMGWNTGASQSGTKRPWSGSPLAKGYDTVGAGYLVHNKNDQIHHLLKDYYYPTNGSYLLGTAGNGGYLPEMGLGGFLESVWKAVSKPFDNVFGQVISQVGGVENKTLTEHLRQFSDDLTAYGDRIHDGEDQSVLGHLLRPFTSLKNLVDGPGKTLETIMVKAPIKTVTELYNGIDLIRDGMTGNLSDEEDADRRHLYNNLVSATNLIVTSMMTGGLSGGAHLAAQAGITLMADPRKDEKTGQYVYNPIGNFFEFVRDGVMHGDWSLHDSFGPEQRSGGWFGTGGQGIDLGGILGETFSFVGGVGKGLLQSISDDFSRAQKIGLIKYLEGGLKNTAQAILNPGAFIQDVWDNFVSAGSAGVLEEWYNRHAKGKGKQVPSGIRDALISVSGFSPQVVDGNRIIDEWDMNEVPGGDWAEFMFGKLEREPLAIAVADKIFISSKVQQGAKGYTTSLSNWGGPAKPKGLSYSTMAHEFAHLESNMEYDMSRGFHNWASQYLKRGATRSEKDTDRRIGSPFGPDGHNGLMSATGVYSPSSRLASLSGGAMGPSGQPYAYTDQQRKMARSKERGGYMTSDYNGRYFGSWWNLFPYYGTHGRRFKVSAVDGYTNTNFGDISDNMFENIYGFWATDANGNNFRDYWRETNKNQYADEVYPGLSRGADFVHTLLPKGFIERHPGAKKNSMFGGTPSWEDPSKGWMGDIYTSRQLAGFGDGGSLEGRQYGGPVKKNKTYVVGESGPELFRSSIGGEIIPNATHDNDLKNLVRELIDVVKDKDTDVHVYTDLEGQVEAQVDDFRAEIRERINREQRMIA